MDPTETMTFNAPVEPDRSLKHYMKEIASSHPLSSKEEADLASRIQMGDIRARNKLVHANLRFVVNVALGYRHRGLSLGELVSAGNIGLFSAADRFDSSRGYRFITYAVWWIRQAILKTLMEKRTVRLPVNRFDLLARASKSFSILQQQMYTDPGPREMAEDLGVTEKELERTLMDTRSSLSLDASLDLDDDSGNSGHHILPDPVEGSLEEELDRKQLQEVISSVLGTLKEREAIILRLYFGLDGGEGHTLEQIGAHLGITRERVRQVKKTAIDKLRVAVRARRLKPYF